MSEDPPLISVAVDEGKRIERIAAEAARFTTTGILTLERSRLVRGAIGRPVLPEQFDEATKLTIYIGRYERADKVPMFVAICDVLHRRGLDGASTFVGVDGTIHGQRARARFFDRNVNVPTMIIAVGRRDTISKVQPELDALLNNPLMTVERVRVCKRDGQLIERPHALPNVDAGGLGLWQKLTIYTSESHLHERQPIHRELTRRLRESSSTRGLTVLRGVWGFHGDHAPHGDRLLQLGRRVPVMTIVVDTPEHIAQSFDIVDGLTQEHGLVTTEMIPALASFGDTGNGGGFKLAKHDY